MSIWKLLVSNGGRRGSVESLKKGEFLGQKENDVNLESKAGGVLNWNDK